MWLMTTQGFYSAVEHRGKKDTILVRARVRGDLERLKKQLPAAKVKGRIYRDDTADYPFRLDLSRAEFGTVLLGLEDDIDYANFKSAVAKKQGHRRAGVYHRIWSVLCDLEQGGGPWARWRAARPQVSVPLRYASSAGQKAVSDALSRGPGRMVDCPDCEDGHDPEVPALACPRCYGFSDIHEDELSETEREVLELREAPADQLVLEAQKRGSRR